MENIRAKYRERWVCTENPLEKFLGLNLDFSEQGVFLNARDYESKLADKWKLVDVKCPKTPVALGRELPYHHAQRRG